jgi:DNA-binding MarR family transcriptional regulator
MMHDFQTPISDQVFHKFLSLLRFTRREDRRLIDVSGMKPRDFSVLRYLLDFGPASVGQVQTYIQKSLSTVSTLIAELEDKGFLSRIRSDEDNRVVNVVLTQSGRMVAKNTPIQGLPLLRRRLGQLSEVRLLEIEGVLNEIRTLMEGPYSE